MKRKWFTLLTALALMAVVLAPLTPARASEPSSTGDGLLPRDQLMKLIRWIYDGHARGMLYEEVVAFVGVEGLDLGNKGPNSMTQLGDHYFDWIDQDDAMSFIHVCFRGQEETGRFEQNQWQTNKIRSEEWKDADLTDWLIAAAAGVGTVDYTAQIQRFSNPAVTVSARIPAERWKTVADSNSLTIMHELGNNFDPRIEVKVYENLEMFDFYIEKFTNIQPAEPCVIAGMEMQGRTYTYMDRDWIEYTRELEDNISLGVITMSSLSLAPGTQGEAVLDSLSFRYTTSDGAEKIYAPNLELASSAAPAAKPTAEPAAEPTAEPAPEPAPQPAVQQPGPAAPGAEAGFAIEYDRKYTAKTFTTNGVSVDAAVLGVYDITFYENGTCDFTLAGTLVKGLKWHEEDGKFVMDYYTSPIAFTPTPEGLIMDYFGSGTLLMI